MSAAGGPNRLELRAQRLGAGCQSTAPMLEGMSHSLHLLAGGADIHLRMSDDTQPAELLGLCADAMRDHRLVHFPDTLAPGAVRRSTVVINFEHVSGAWIDSDV
jgi:hypothetical protein